MQGSQIPGTWCNHAEHSQSEFSKTVDMVQSCGTVEDSQPGFSKTVDLVQS